MSDFTPRANLRLPGGGSTGTILPDEQVDIDVLNDNFRKIDALLGARNIPSASSYAGSMDGDLVYAQDTEFLHMFSANAGGLITPRLPGSKMFSGTRAQRMAFTGARDGDMWRDTDNIGIIWAFKAGSPGTWEYTGNLLRGTKAALNQAVTDSLTSEGMEAYATDEKKRYRLIAGAWVSYLVARGAANTSTGVGGTLILALSTPTLSKDTEVIVNASPVGASHPTAGTPINYTLTYTMDGSPITNASPVLRTLRSLAPSGGAVTTFPGYTTRIKMPSDNVLRVGMYNGAAVIYGADGQFIEVYLV